MHVWQLYSDLVCEDYSYPRKSDCPDSVLRSYFYEHMNQAHSNTVHIYTDGAKNEHGVGCSAVSLSGSRNMKLKTDTSIFSAELCGILCGLKLANRVNTIKFTIFCDSKSVLQSVEHFDSTNPLIHTIVVFLMRLKEKGKTVHFCWSPSHIGIPGNERADKLAAETSLRDSQYLSDELPYRGIGTL